MLSVAFATNKGAIFSNECNASECCQLWREFLVAWHLKTADDLFDSKPSPRTESMVAAAVQWAERIMKKIDDVFPT